MNKTKIIFTVKLVICRPKLIFKKSLEEISSDQKRHLVHHDNNRLSIVKQCDLLEIHHSETYLNQSTRVC